MGLKSHLFELRKICYSLCGFQVRGDGKCSWLKQQISQCMLYWPRKPSPHLQNLEFFLHPISWLEARKNDKFFSGNIIQGACYRRHSKTEHSCSLNLYCKLDMFPTAKMVSQNMCRGCYEQGYSLQCFGWLGYSAVFIWASIQLKKFSREQPRPQLQPRKRIWPTRILLNLSCLY